MADNEHSDLGFQRRGGNLLKSSSQGTHIATTMSTTWDPHVPLSHNPELKGSTMGSHNPIALSPYSVGMLGNLIANNSSNNLRYSLDPSFLEPSSKLSSFGSGSFSTMVSSFGLPEYDQISNASCPDYLSTEEGTLNTNLRKVDVNAAMFRGELQISDEGGSGSSPDAKKRKREPDHRSDTIHTHFQSGEAQHQKDVSQESIEGQKEWDGKKQKMEKNSGTNSRGNSTGKQAKDSSQNEQSSKEDYIHVRARRGQATNSHSLAERVRREKISQRMKYLQDLVPGCDKITGKALMLDEIINYVQSLQRQVEFLSMKLSTVNPELNIDIERIMSREILHSQVGGSSILGFGPGMSSPQMHVSSRGPGQAMHCTDSHVQPAPQTHSAWDDELQNIIQMGLMSNPATER